MKITVLIEDTASNDNLTNEAGLSIFIETDRERILLDTGRSGNFADNAGKLGINLARVDACVISHAHYDHSGGLDRFFKINKTTPVFMHESAVGDYFVNQSGKWPLPVSIIAHPFVRYSESLSKYIGIDTAVVEANRDRIHFISQAQQVTTNAWLITNIVRNHPVPKGNRFLLEKNHEKLQKDTFRHEIILAIKEPDGIVLFSGCCHNGILNMIDAVEDRFDDLPIKAIVGGFHLVLQTGKDRMSCSPAQAKAMANAFIEKDIKSIYTGHCTGRQAFDTLETHLDERLHHLSTGLFFII